MRRWRGLLAALVPLAAGIGGYWLYWRAAADDFADKVEALTGAPAAIGGFPYRLSARIEGLALARGEAASVRFDAGRAALDTQPLREGLYVGHFTDVRLTARLGGLKTARTAIAAPAARASLRTDESGLVERFSARFRTANVELGWLDGAVGASELELHMRETPNAAATHGPTPPVQAEARIAGTFAAGAVHMALVIPVKITAEAPLASLSAWRDGGTVEIDGARLTAVNGAALADFSATLGALPGGELAVAGTLATDCPLTVAALFGGEPAPTREFRTRRPARFVLTGTLDRLRLTRRAAPSGGAVRSREPPCPDLRR